jgi:S1-C subfamily serine protease
MAAVGQPAELVVWRERQLWTIKVQVGERERTIAQMTGAATEPSPSPSPRGGGGLLRRPDRPGVNSTHAVGLELQTLDEPGTAKFGYPKAVRGAIVLRIAPESPLAAHLQPLDVIHSVNGLPVKSAEDASRALSAHATTEILFVSFDRLVNGKVESKTVRVP